MSKLLQVIAADLDYREIQHSAKSPGISIAEWVRQALRSARREEPRGDAARKLQVLRAAGEHSFPTADIEKMLGQIERGYLDAPSR